MMVQMGLLGALLTFSGSALYAPHLLTTQAWGMSPLQDQQLAGLIMWVPAAGLSLGAAMFLLARWFRQEAARGFATCEKNFAPGPGSIPDPLTPHRGAFPFPG